MHMTYNELYKQRGKQREIVFTLPLDPIYESWKVQQPRVLIFAEVQATEVGFDVLAVPIIIYLEVLIMLFGFMTTLQNIYIYS